MTCNFGVRSLCSLGFFEWFYVEIHRSNALMIIGRMSSLPASATIARPECHVSWAEFAEQMQSILTKDDLMDS